MYSVFGGLFPIFSFFQTVSVYDKDERHQMVKELNTFNNASSPHIMSFIGASFAEGRITMALEFMNRGDLNQVMKKYGPLPENVLRPIIRQTLLGLQHLHQKHLVHRDIK